MAMRQTAVAAGTSDHQLLSFAAPPYRGGIEETTRQIRGIQPVLV